MGSLASLSLDNISLELSVNYQGRWGHYFTAADKNSAIYEYEDGKKVRRPAYVKKLKEIRKILEISGNALTSSDPFAFYTSQMNKAPDKVSAEICDRISKLRVTDIKENPEYWNTTRSVPRLIFNDEKIYELAKKHRINPAKELGYPQLLYLLSKNKENENSKLVWKYMDLVDGGWCTEEEISSFVGKVEPHFLIITEGSSDTFVIKKSLEILEPGVAPYFRFIDMSENYPFTGTGNLYRFCQGLAKIGVENRILILFDNDTEGLSKYKETIKLDLPVNIKPVVLPNLKEAMSFPSIGPNGEFKANLNGTAVSIEMFLDLKHSEIKKPKVRWSSYDQGSGHYQGHLERKDEYVRKFKSVKSKKDNYDFRKLGFLVNWLIDECKVIQRQPFIY